MILNPQSDRPDSEVSAAFYTGLHRYSFRAGESALIIGVVFVRNKPGAKAHLCYHIRYADGSNDYVVITDNTMNSTGDMNGSVTVEPYAPGALKDKLL